MDRSERYQQFEVIYQSEIRPPWDTGIVPPELRSLIEGGDELSPGQALDAGCGTGTNAIYLAQQGWQVTGVEWIAEAVETARSKAADAGLGQEQLSFVQASVAAPVLLPDHPPVDLWLDIGCVHSLEDTEQRRYADHVQRLTASDGWVLIYAWLPPDETQIEGPPGLSIEHFDEWVGPDFHIEETVVGREATNDTIASAWHLLHRR